MSRYRPDPQAKRRNLAGSTTGQVARPAFGGLRSWARAGAGFTLLELLVVVAIIGLLAAYVGPKYFSQLGRSEQGVAKAQVEAFARALDTYRLEVGRYPTTEEGLDALLSKPANAARWNGPYLQKAVPPDPWGRAYIYRSPGANADFEIMSYGKDGQPGGSGDAADVSYQ